jgi:hypothetical protein
MKKYAIPVVVVLAILAVTLSTFGQAQDRAGQRRGGQNWSEEERAQFRERFQNMSEEEQAPFREQFLARGGRSRMSTEDQQKAIKAIEGALVKVKAAAQVQMPQGGFRDLAEDERNKIMTAFRGRGTALNAIVAQVAKLQGRTQPEGEGARFMIINTADLKPIQEAATKEKAEETVRLLQRLAGRGRGFGGGRTGGGGARRGNQ